MFVDIHAHLDFPQFEKDLDEVIERAKKAGVKAIISNGVHPDSNRKTLELAKKYDIVKPALGAYPLDIIGLQRTKAFDLDKEIDFITEHKKSVAAIGEVGLDDFHFPGNLDKQVPNFEKLIQLSEDIRKPIIVHSRKAEERCIEILETSKAKIVMHCFSGSKKLIKRIIDNNWMFSIPTSVVRNQHFQMLAEMAPSKNILTETDAPYLSPFPDKRNEPAFIPEAVKAIAKVKDLTVDDASKVIFQNFQRFF